MIERRLAGGVALRGLRPDAVVEPREGSTTASARNQEVRFSVQVLGLKLGTAE